MSLRANNILAERLTFEVDLASAFQTGATCTITVDTNANMADGDKVTIDDGMQKVVYEYDKSANGVAAGNVSWAAGAGTAAQSATTLATAIATKQTGFSVVDNADGTLSLTHKWADAGNPAGNTKTSSSALAITAWVGSAGRQGITATTTVKRWKALNRAFRVDRVTINCPAGFTTNASAYWTLALKDGSTTIASYSTQTTGGSPGGQGTLTADTPTDFVLSATDASLVLADGDVMSLVATKTSTPAAFPSATLVIEGRYL